MTIVSSNQYSRYRMSLVDYVMILICIVLIPSAVIYSSIGLDEKYTFAILTPFALLFCLIAKRSLYSDMLFVAVAVLMMTGSVAALVARSYSQILMAVTLSIALIVGRQLFVTLYNPAALRIVSWFALILLIGGVIGIGYSALDGQPLLEVQVGYRITGLYLTTFSLAQIGNLIRPSGIFDEPGAFVMFVGIITMFNDTLQRNQKLNLLLVALMVFTGSLAGLILSAIYIVFSNERRRYLKRNLGYAIAAIAMYLTIGAIYSNSPITMVADTFYGERLQIVDGRLVGDNRSNQVSYFFETVDNDILIHGAKYLRINDGEEDMSSNPFSITYGYGIIISLPYFAILFWLIVTSIRFRLRNGYATLGLFVILLQRPYVYHMSWSILIAATIWLIYFEIRAQHANANC